MNWKIISPLAICLLLISCSNNENNVEKTEKNHKSEVEEAIEEKVENKTDEQYLSEFKLSDAYQNYTQDTEVVFTEVIDFEGDGVPEIALGTNNEQTECNVSIYKIDNSEWVEDVIFTYTSNIAIFLDPLGKLTYDNGSQKEALAFSWSEAGASSMSQSFSILNFNKDTNAIEELIRMPLESSESLAANLEKNTITVTSAYDETIMDYIFDNGEIVNSNGEAIGIIIDEELAKLVGTTINNYFISLDDSYYFAKEKVTEPLLDESHYEGGLCSYYETFFICNYDGGMHAYHITPANRVTADELSNYFNQTIEISEWENLLEGGYSYTAEVTTDSGMYELEFNSNTSESEVESITYIPY